MRPLGAWYDDPAQGRLAVAIVDIDHERRTAACVHEDGTIFIIGLLFLNAVRLDLTDGTGTHGTIEAVKERMPREVAA